MKQQDLFDLPEMTFTVSYDADDIQLEQHRMDAVLLAQSIQNIANLIQRADEIINGGEYRNLQLYVSAPAKQGSMMVEFVTSLINPENAQMVLKALGIVAPITATSMGIFKALSQIKDNEICEIHTDDSEQAKIIFANGKEMIVEKDEAKLIASPKIREYVRNIVANPLSHRAEPVFKINVQDEAHQNKTALQLDTQQIDALTQLKTIAPIPKIDKITTQATFSQINFKEQTGWKITILGGDTVSAYLNDQNFLDTIRANQHSFRKDDVYNMVLETTISTNEFGKESKKYKILQVLPLSELK